MTLCVIPARGGSKRIPHKNVRSFHGRPMIAWSISAALESGMFDRVVVSTDDPKIADVAVSEGAEVPFMRPADLSDDHTATAPVIAHAIQSLGEDASTNGKTCCLYATAPFVSAKDIATAYQTLEEAAADFAFPVTTFAHPTQRAVYLRANGRMEMCQPEHALTRSQDLEETYHDVGQFYWGRNAAWQAGKAIIGPDAAPLVIPRYRAQDIDTPEDWDLAERLFAALNDE